LDSDSGLLDCKHCDEANACQSIVARVTCALYFGPMV
jgi:hypothetical protein